MRRRIDRLAETLDRPKFGAESDFCQKGRDCMSTNWFQTARAGRGPAISAADIHENGTPRNLDKINAKNRAEETCPEETESSGGMSMLRKEIRLPAGTNPDRMYSGSVFGLNRKGMFLPETNPRVTVFLDEKVDPARLQNALDRALLDCPYITRSLEKDEGLFFRIIENRLPLPLTERISSPINSPENNGHAAAVSCAGNRVTVAVSHALTDGRGTFWFLSSLLDHYYGNPVARKTGAGEPDFETDPLETELPVSQYISAAEERDGKCLTFPMAVQSDPKDCFLYRTSSEAFSRLCRERRGTMQQVLDLLGLSAARRAWPDQAEWFCARNPVDARKMLGIPHAYRNASLANMHIRLSAGSLDPGNEESAMQEIRQQFSDQYREDYILSQLNDWRRVIMTENREERLARIAPLISADSVVISSFGRLKVSEACLAHIRGLILTVMIFPVMLYGMEIGDFLMLMGYDGTGEGKYAAAVRKELERNGLSIENMDTETGEIMH